MRKFRFCVIYIEGGKIKHKQISAYSAPCAIEDFKLLKPNAQVLEAGLGCVSKEYWKVLKEKEDSGYCIVCGDDMISEYECFSTKEAAEARLKELQEE